jgi:hypothetical protein
MKARFAVAAIMTLATAPLAAQGGARMGGQGMNLDNLTSMYSLSAEQKTKTETLLATYTEATKGVTAWMMKLRESGADRAAMASAPGFADSTKKQADASAKFRSRPAALARAPQLAMRLAAIDRSARLLMTVAEQGSVKPLAKVWP